MARLARGLGVAALADAAWMLAAPRKWRRFWLVFTHVVGRVGRVRWVLAALQATVGLAMLKSAPRPRPR
jgi:hypothetical protein